MSLGDYKKTRGNMVLARDELEALFDVGSDADMEDGEVEGEVPSPSTRVDPSVGSRRPREDDSEYSATTEHCVHFHFSPYKNTHDPFHSHNHSLHFLLLLLIPVFSASYPS
ncbi:unnamed protein product [Phytophthora fragariaefolia]|uniref:Unnamed protein product n=1 Tax=Phytophthora fragariaefolia TaxID=1490495 RepID=A0A9W7DAL3_9STRA|nr:unnamed protein product [Phytophthora fragariaefolia]